MYDVSEMLQLQFLQFFVLFLHALMLASHCPTDREKLAPPMFEGLI
jgi:hypothetical protein